MQIVALGVKTGAAAVRIVLQILAVVSRAICEPGHAPALTASAHAPGVVAVVSALTAVVHIGDEIRAIVVAGGRPHGTDAIARDAASTIGTVVAASAAVVHIARDVRAGIATSYLAQGTGALTSNARGPDRAEYATRAAGDLAGRDIDAAEIATAIHRTHIADASP